jgi:hypothetical protein
MQFGRWIPLEEASRHAPVAAGVFQIRVKSGLIRYPRGQSAMVYYAASQNLEQAVSLFAQAHREKPYLCRFAEVAGGDPNPELSRLVSRFENRFGSPPRMPA